MKLIDKIDDGNVILVGYFDRLKELDTTLSRCHYAMRRNKGQSSHCLAFAKDEHIFQLLGIPLVDHWNHTFDPDFKAVKGFNFDLLTHAEALAARKRIDPVMEKLTEDHSNKNFASFLLHTDR